MSFASGLPTPIRKLLADAELVLEAPYTRRIFTNRDLAFERVTVIGFDMDYTLAVYRQDELEALSIRCTLDKLLLRGYPEALRDIRSDPAFAIRGLVVELNARQMRGFGSSRAELFAEIDRPRLGELPDQPYVFARWKRCRVAPDYHVEIDGHWYSTPYRLIRELVDVRIAQATFQDLRTQGLGQRFVRTLVVHQRVVARPGAVPDAAGEQPAQRLEVDAAAQEERMVMGEIAKNTTSNCVPDMPTQTGISTAERKITQGCIEQRKFAPLDPRVKRHRKCGGSLVSRADPVVTCGADTNTGDSLYGHRRLFTMVIDARRSMTLVTSRYLRRWRRRRRWLRQRERATGAEPKRCDGEHTAVKRVARDHLGRA